MEKTVVKKTGALTDKDLPDYLKDIMRRVREGIDEEEMETGKKFKDEETERKFKDVGDFDIVNRFSDNLIWAKEVLSLLQVKAYTGNEYESDTPPIFLISEALGKLTEAGELNDELWNRYKEAKDIIQESSEFKKFKKMKDGKN